MRNNGWGGASGVVVVPAPFPLSENGTKDALTACAQARGLGVPTMERPQLAVRLLLHVAALCAFVLGWEKSSAGEGK